jgi:hypothetical protein
VEVEPPPRRWEVSFTTSLQFDRGKIWLGTLLLRCWAQRFVLLGEDGEVFDARCRLDGEVVKQGMQIVFPCHTAVVGCAMDPVSNSAVNMRPRNWWLYTLPVGGAGVSAGTGLQTKLEEEDGGGCAGPTGPGPGSDTDKVGFVSSLIHSETLV